MELASGAGLVSWSSQGRWKSLGVPPRPALPAEEVSGLPFSSQTQFPVPELLALVLSATPSCPPRTFPPICISWEAVFGARGVPRPCAVRLPRTRRQLAGVGRPALWSTVFSCACAAGPGRAVRKSSSSRRRAELPARLEFSWNERVWVCPGSMLEETFVLGALVSCSCAGASARGHPCTGPPESPSAQCGAPARGVAVCAFVPGPGGGGGVCSPGLPVLLASQPGHPFRAGVSTACWGTARTLGPSLCHGPCLPGWLREQCACAGSPSCPSLPFSPSLLGAV